MSLKQFITNTFLYIPRKEHNFILPQNSNNEVVLEEKNKQVSKSINSNLNYIKTKYNTLINKDIVLKSFTITVNNKNLKAFIFFIEDMVDGEAINATVLKPLFLKNDIDMTIENHPEKLNNFFNLKKYITRKILPNNSITTETLFKTIFQKANSGYTILFIDKCDSAFCIEAKNLKGRTNAEAKNETIVRGSQEAFVENSRINTGLIRKIINNENLIIEEFSVGNITNTQISICYLSNITNNELIAEIKYRIKNLKIDSLISSGQLEQFLVDKQSFYPQTIATERTDRTCNYILGGRVAILVNGSPYALIIPAIFTDFLTSPEDLNLNYNYSNFLRFIRSIALVFAIFLPGMYIAITTFHIELIPSELLFALETARDAIPFPIIFEILIMEISFDLIREAGIRVPSPFGQTIGIIRSFNFRRCSSCC